MKITTENLPASQIRFNVEVEGDHSRTIYDRIVKDMMRSVRVPGFRPGKAPKQLVINHVGSDSIKASLVDTLMKDVLTKVFQKADSQEVSQELIGIPDIEPDLDDLIDTLEVGQTFSISVTFDYNPEVILGDYKNIVVKAEDVKPDPDYVAKTLHQYQLRYATLVPVEGRCVQEGDVVTLESEGINLADGSIIEELTAKEAQFTLDENLLQLDLFAMVVGMNLGESKEQELLLPPEFPIEELQGQPVRVKHRVVDIKYRDLPPLDDDFARSISQKETLEELEAFLQERAIEEAEMSTMINIEDALLFALEEMTTVDLPNSLVEVEVNKLIRQNAKAALQSMGIPEDDVDQFMTPEIMSNFRDLALEEATKNVKHEVALLKLAQLEKLEIPDQDYKETLAEAKKSLAGQSYDEKTLTRIITESFYRNQALEWLKQNATIELIPGAEEQPEAEDLVHNTDS